MTFLERLSHEMLAICAARAMPQHYATDISHDLAVINCTDATRFVWLIREHGTCMLPVGRGVEPVHIEYYLQETTHRKVYLITAGQAQIQIEPISDKKALDLIYQEPARVSCESPVWPQVKTFLEGGISARFWGIFDSPQSVDDHSGIEGWLRYFQQMGNSPMGSYLRHAQQVQQAQQRLLTRNTAAA